MLHTYEPPTSTGLPPPQGPPTGTPCADEEPVKPEPEEDEDEA